MEDKFGFKLQTLKAIEELSELSKVLCKILIESEDSELCNKKFLSYNYRLNLIEEISDVLIMITQMRVTYNISDISIENYMNEKLTACKNKFNL